MIDEIDKIIETLASEIIILIQTKLKEQGIDEKSKLYQNLKVEVDSSGQTIVIDILFDNYITYIENGRAPKTGKRPPIESLKDWAQNKGISTDNATLHAISTAIWRDGIEPRPILAALENEIEAYLDNELSDKLLNAITATLNTYFE